MHCKNKAYPFCYKPLNGLNYLLNIIYLYFECSPWKIKSLNIWNMNIGYRFEESLYICIITSFLLRLQSPCHYKIIICYRITLSNVSQFAKVMYANMSSKWIHKYWTRNDQRYLKNLLLGWERIKWSLINLSMHTVVDSKQRHMINWYPFHYWVMC